MYAISFADKGFSIEGGLIYDRPLGDSHKPYTGMEGGFGYIANFAYDFFDRAGLEFGVMHTSHDYELAVVNNAVIQASADKTTIFLKARAYPLMRGKSEIIIGFGGGLFDISGPRIIDNLEWPVDFSGVGLVASLDYRYNITPGLALSAYLGLNLVSYDRYEEFGYKADYPEKMPKGNSLCWGFTVFHRIGIPQL